MSSDDPQFAAFLAGLKKERAASGWSNLGNALGMAVLGGALAYWAFGTLAHTALFAFMLFAVSAVGNRIHDELRQQRASDEAARLRDRN